MTHRRLLLLLLGLAVAGLFGSILWASGAGSFPRELRTIATLPWGAVTLIDLYLGLALLAGWVIHREPRPWLAAAWIAAFCCLGNLAAGLYVLVALARDGADRERFWHGRRMA